MLQSIREHTQGWIAGTIIGIIILSFALWGIHSYFVGGGPSTTVAEVNGVEINQEQLKMTSERLRRQTQAQMGANAASLNEATLREQALQGLITVEVLKQAAINEGFFISNRQIDTYLQFIPDFQVGGRFSIERFQEVLSASMFSPSEFLEVIKTTLLIDQPRLGTILTSFALPNETAYAVSLINQERNISFLTIPTAYFLSQPITIAPEKINAYYTANKNTFMTPETVSVEYIELSLADLAARIIPSQDVLENFYNENINTYTQPSAWKLIILEAPLLPSATAEEVAKAQNEISNLIKTISSEKNLQDLPSDVVVALNSKNWVTLSKIPSELQKSVAGLTRPNQTTEPVKTLRGIAIAKAIEVKEPEIQPFAVVSEQVKQAYIRQHAEEKFTELREQLTEAAYEHPDSLQMAAKNLDLPIKTSELFSRNQGGKDISQYKKTREVAFSNEVLNLQNNSDTIQLNPETVVVMRIKSHIPSTVIPLKDVSTKIADKLKAQEAEERTVKLAEELKAKLQNSENPAAIAIDPAFKWVDAGFIGRYANKVEPAIVDIAFRLPNPETSKNKMAYGMTRLTNGYAIVALKAVKPGTVLDSKQTSVFAEQVQNADGMLEYELYKQSQSRAAKIKIQE